MKKRTIRVKILGESWWPVCKVRMYPFDASDITQDYNIDTDTYVRWKNIEQDFQNIQREMRLLIGADNEDK